MSRELKNEQALLTEIAQLESVNDQVVAELTYINNLLYAVGFTKGIQSLKDAAQELLEDDQE